jgi:hypothetical protein
MTPTVKFKLLYWKNFKKPQTLVVVLLCVLHLLGPFLCQHQECNPGQTTLATCY